VVFNLNVVLDYTLVLLKCQQKIKSEECVKKNVELTTFKMTFHDHIVMREHRFRALLCCFEALVREIAVRALVLQNHPKNIRLFELSENKLT
jgi:hypothetical protein